MALDDVPVARISGGFLAYQYEVLGIRDAMASPDVTEICINRPGEIYVESRSGWERVEVPSLNFERARQFCTAVVNESNTGQRITILQGVPQFYHQMTSGCLPGIPGEFFSKRFPISSNHFLI